MNSLAVLYMLSALFAVQFWSFVMCMLYLFWAWQLTDETGRLRYRWLSSIMLGVGFAAMSAQSFLVEFVGSLEIASRNWMSGLVFAVISGLMFWVAARRRARL